MHSSHHHHVHSSHRFESEFAQVFIHRTIRAFGISLFAIFLPIYLFELSEDAFFGLLLMTSYFGIFFISRMLLTVPVANLIAKIGGKHVLRLSTFSGVVFLLLLANIERSGYIFGLVPVVHGLTSTLFFTALHFELSYSTGKKKTHGVGSVEIARKIAMALGPLVGGFLAVIIGFENLVYIAALIVGLSILPLHLQKEPLKGVKPVNPHKVRELLRSDKSCRANFGMALNTGAATICWPLFIYLFLTSYKSVGLVVSLSLVIAILIMLKVRKRESSSSIKNEITNGGKGTAGVHLLRTIAVNPLLITVVNIANDIFIAYFHVPYIAQYYKNASQKNRSTYISAMEISYAAGILFLLVLLVIGYQLTNDMRYTLTIGFVAGALGVLANKDIVGVKQIV